MPSQNKYTAPQVREQAIKLIDKEWEEEVLTRLPAGTEEQAFHMGAFVRCREIKSVGDLLRALLAYVLCVSSFRQLGSVAWFSQHFRDGLAQSAQRSHRLVAVALGSITGRSAGFRTAEDQFWPW